MDKMNVLGMEIFVVCINDGDYISLTDMVRNIENGDFFILNWLYNRNTIDFLGIWERVYNANFNPAEFDRVKSQSGLNSYRISVLYTGHFTTNREIEILNNLVKLRRMSQPSCLYSCSLSL